MRLSAFETYCLYLALKNHFSRESYDFFKYNGKTTANKDAFMSRRDRFQFQKISRMYSAEDMQDLFVSNFLKDKAWVGDMLDDDSNEIFLKYRRRRQSLTYTFTNELDSLFTNDQPDKVFKATKGSFAPILTYIIREDVSYESAVVLDHFIGFSKNFDSIFNSYRLKIKKYQPFVEFDKNKMKVILKEKLHEYGSSSQRQEASQTAC
jgi:hypothetical protein